MNPTPKIALFTLTGYDNYGNRLQNYAVQQILNAYGYDTETIFLDIACLPKKHGAKALAKKLKKCLRLRPSAACAKIRDKLARGLSRGLAKQREQRFRAFVKEYIKEIDLSKFDESNYAFFAAGSDQIWNLDFWGQGSEVYTIPFGEEKQRFAFSASCGVSAEIFGTFPQPLLDTFRVNVSKIAHISVREAAGAEIVRAFAGREAKVLLDPTMLLEREEWLKIARKPKWLKNITIGGG